MTYMTGEGESEREQGREREREETINGSPHNAAINYPILTP